MPKYSATTKIDLGFFQPKREFFTAEDGICYEYPVDNSGYDSDYERKNNRFESKRSKKSKTKTKVD